jgi:uncharacterized protein (DUF952 family)
VALTYHGTARAHFESLPPDEPYLPRDFERDGFIHCTDGADRLIEVLNQFYASEEGDWIALVIETDRLTSELRYDDPERLFPHIYGPVNREAIVEVLPLRRADGLFVLASASP